MLKSGECPGIENEIEICPQNRGPIKITEENEDFVFLLNRILPGLIRSDGSFDYSAIGTIFKLYEINRDIQEYYFDKCLIVISVIKEKRQRKDG